MSSMFLFDENTQDSKVNIDELYEKRQKRDLKQLGIFNKVLNRVHKRINHTAKNKFNQDTHIWYNVPEYLVGEPVYDKGECIAYVYNHLEDNGFHVKYIHPNTLFISWHNWIPSYVRNEVKKKSGIVIDERGNIIESKTPEENLQTNPLNQLPNYEKKEETKFLSVKDYKPTGTFLYGDDVINKLEKRLNN